MGVLSIARGADQMLVLLEDVAQKQNATEVRYEPGHPVWELIASHAAASHTDETLLLAWTDFADQVRDRDMLDDGTLTWQQLFDADDCAGKDHAIDILCGRIDDAYGVIRRGPRGPRGAR